MNAQEVFDNWSAYLRPVDRPDFLDQLKAISAASDKREPSSLLDPAEGSRRKAREEFADALEGKSEQKKPICYGIVNAAGKMHTSESCISSDRESLSAELEPLVDEEPDDGWEIVPFYAGPSERRGT